jgi:hypothetical protein
MKMRYASQKHVDMTRAMEAKYGRRGAGVVGDGV